MDVEALNLQFGKPSQIEFFYLADSHLPAVLIETNHARCIISLYGAQVLCFQPLGSTESIIWENQNAVFKEGKAIRGGIPICWPWFNAHPLCSKLPNHGFARTSMWNVICVEKQNKQITITFELIQNAQHLQMFDYQFKLQYTVRVSRDLTLALTTMNTGKKPFQISQALHSYFSVADIAKTTLYGFNQCEYFDETQHEKLCLQKGNIIIDQEIDRFYMNTSNEINIVDETRDHCIIIKQSGTNATQLWNPWIERAKAFTDFADNDYKRMVCVEAVNLHDQTITLYPYTQHTLAQEISVHKLAPH